MKKIKNSEEGMLNEISPWIRALILTVLPALLYAPALRGGIPFLAGGARYSDFLITHYPNLVFLRNSLKDFHQLPLWNTIIFSGTPFASDPLSNLFYLPNWLGMLFPLPEGLNIITAIHGIWCAWGTYYLLLNLRINERGAISGAISFALFPKLAAHFGAGHISLLYALAWTPWLLVARHWDKNGWIMGAVAGMLFLADPRWAPYAGLLWLTQEIAYREYLARDWKYYGKALLSSVLIASPLLFPLLEFIPLSTRVALDKADLLQFSLPAVNLIGLVIPTPGSNPEWFLYLGGSSLGIILIGLAVPNLRKKNAVWFISAAFSILLALGIIRYAGEFITKIPGLSLLRVPSRSLFVVGFCGAVILAQTVDYLITVEDWVTKLKPLSFGMVVFASAMGAGVAYLLSGFRLWYIWGFGFLVLLGVLLLFASQLKHLNGLWTAILVLIACDLLGAGWGSYQIKQETAAINPEILQKFEKDQEDFRIYSPSYSIQQITAVKQGIELADGIDPLQVAAYADYMARADGVSERGYSVTIPPFITGNPEFDNSKAIPDPDLLGLLNVKYVISQFPLLVDEFDLLYSGDGQFLYLNQNALPRAWLEADSPVEEEIPVAGAVGVDLTSKLPNQIELKANGPGRLVLSEIAYPGWQAYVDGKSVKVEVAYGLLRSVYLDQGEHEVLFAYHPHSVYTGLLLAALGWIGAAYIFLRRHHARLSNQKT